ncbi:hypothetical protein IE077_001765 [Cardiosporidium cionae]|uniref:Uncharacterized protein n=1 Tax=Cardiosporidium cionae TaxID=476202 RepID=A0ABQ7J559_9APIC|nr:hypothetical protein IE077_001765 [Cardiosporidium cionae]|eukprot:KAF8819059.1 hypothetical protein IE077_001765 [Cardiosporidium cionae]
MGIKSLVLSWYVAVTLTQIVATEIPTLKGGMSVGMLRIANDAGGNSGIFFGREGIKFGMQIDTNEQFLLTRNGESLLTIDSDDVINILVQRLSTKSLGLLGSIHINGVPQFRLVHREDFMSKEAIGWDNKNSKKIVSECAGITMLGGYGIFSNGEITKKFGNLPPHSEIRIKAAFHFIDAWMVLAAFMRMDIGSEGAMVHVWTERHSQDLEQSAVNVCGGDVGEGKFASPIVLEVRLKAMIRMTSPGEFLE